MHWIDLSVVVAYLIATLALGVWLSRRVRDSRDFFLGGRRLPFWAIGMSLVVSDIGALEMIGGTGNAWAFGIAQANYEWIGCVPAMVVGGLVFIPLFWRQGVHSVPEYLGRSYGPAVRALLAVVAVVFMVATVGVFFHAAASMAEGILGWDRWIAVSGIATIVAVYTVGGGLGAVIVTDVVQCSILMVGGIALAVLGLVEVGGFDGLGRGLEELGERAEHHLSLLQPVERLDPDGQPTAFPWSGILLGLGLVLSPAYWFGNQAIVQRTLAAKDEWNARASMVFGAFLKTFVPIAFVLPGLIGAVLLSADSGMEPNLVYPTLITGLIPDGAGLRGLLYAAFLAALMSSVDSYANSSATVFTRDLYRRFLRPGGDEKSDLRLGRIVSVSVIALGVATVPLVDRFGSIYEAFQTYVSYFQGPILALLCGAVFARRPTAHGGIACLVGGIATAVALHAQGVQFLHVAWWSFVASAALLALGNRIGRDGRVESAHRGGGP